MLGRTGLRIVTSEAIRGKTQFGDNVLDSEIGVLSTDADGNVVTDQERPFVAIYTDTGLLETSHHGLRALLSGGLCDLVIELGISARMIVRNDNGSKEVFEGLPATDAAFEQVMDLVARQIVDALLDPEDEWAAIFQAMFTNIVRVERNRVGHHNNGVRLAAQEIRIRGELVDDPVRGCPLVPGGAFALLLEKLEGSADPARLQFRDDVIAIVGGAGPQWRSTQYQRGLSSTEAVALGIRPAVLKTDGSEPDFLEVEIETGAQE